MNLPETTALHPFATVILPAGLWLLLGAGLLFALRRGAGRFRPSVAGATPLVALAVIAVAGLFLRLAFCVSGPGNFIDAQRVHDVLHGPLEPDHLVHAGLALPWSAVGAPLFAAEAGLHTVLSALAPLLGYLLVSLWAGSRAALGSALLLALGLTPLRIGTTSSAGVTLAFVLLLAVTTTELWLRRPSLAGALAASAPWALVFHTRPEAPAYAGGLLLWMLLDSRFRRRLGRRPVLLPFALLPLGSLAADLVVRSQGGVSIRDAGFLPWDAGYWSVSLQNLWALAGDPAYHNPLVALLAVVGLVRTVAWRRGLLLALLLVPPLAIALVGPCHGGCISLNVSHHRYAMPLQVLLALPAGWGLATLAQLLSRRLGRGADLVWGVFLLGLALAPLGYRAMLFRPLPIQAQAAFLQDHAELVPAGSLLLTMLEPPAHEGNEAVRNNLEPPLPRPTETGSISPDACPPQTVLLDPETADAPAFLRRCPRPVFYFRGWAEHNAASDPCRFEDRDPAAFRARLEADFALEALARASVDVIGYQSFVGPPMDVALFRAQPRF